MMEKDPEYIVYFTYLNRNLRLTIIRWSDRALLEVDIRSIIRKKLTKNLICRLDNRLESLSPGCGFINPANIIWKATYDPAVAFDWYMSTDLGNLEEVLKDLDPGRIINHLYYVY